MMNKSLRGRDEESSDNDRYGFRAVGRLRETATADATGSSFAHDRHKKRAAVSGGF
jgi:hypothetical protein